MRIFQVASYLCIRIVLFFVHCHLYMSGEIFVELQPGKGSQNQYPNIVVLSEIANSILTSNNTG